MTGTSGKSKKSSKTSGRSKRGGSAVDVITDCDNVDMLVIVLSPKALILARLKVDDVLEVNLRTQAGKQVVEVLYKGDTLGSIAPPSLKKLIDCLRTGHPFYGIVTEAAKGICKVRLLSGRSK